VGGCAPYRSFATSFSEAAARELGREQLEHEHDDQTDDQLADVEVVDVDPEPVGGGRQLEQGER